MKSINMTIVYWFYIYIYLILDITVAFISCSVSKVTSEAVENNGLIGLISPTQPLLAVPQTAWGMGKPDDGYHCKQLLLVVVGMTGCSSYELTWV